MKIMDRVEMKTPGPSLILGPRKTGMGLDRVMGRMDRVQNLVKKTYPALNNINRMKSLLGMDRIDRVFPGTQTVNPLLPRTASPTLRPPTISRSWRLPTSPCPIRRSARVCTAVEWQGRRRGRRAGRAGGRRCVALASAGCGRSAVAAKHAGEPLWPKSERHGYEKFWRGAPQRGGTPFVLGLLDSVKKCVPRKCPFMRGLHIWGSVLP